MSYISEYVCCTGCTSISFNGQEHNITSSICLLWAMVIITHNVHWKNTISIKAAQTTLFWVRGDVSTNTIGPDTIQVC